MEKQNRLLKHLKNCEACGETLCSIGEKIYQEIAIEGRIAGGRCKNTASYRFSNQFAETFLCKQHAEEKDIASQLNGMKKEKWEKNARCEVGNKA